MKIKDQHTIILLAVFGGLAFWAADAVIDALFFSHLPLQDSLFYYNGSPHKHVARLLFFIGFVLLGLLATRTLIKHLRIGKRYRDLVDLSNDIITITDRDGKYVFMNDAAYRVLERTPEEVIGRPFMELWHHEDRKKYQKKLEELEKLNTDTFIFENRYLTKRGKAISVVQTVRVLRDAKGTFIGTQSIAKDITDRKQVEETLRKAITQAENEKARSEAILSSIDEGISIHGPDFKVLYQNPAYLSIFGRENREEYCYQSFVTGDSPCPDCQMEGVIRDGKILTLEKEITRNGVVRSLEVKVSPLRDPSGNSIAAIEMVTDITSRKSAEAKLRMFSVAIEEAMEGIQIIDLDGYIIYSNKAVGDIYGFSHEDLVGKHVSAMVADREFAMKSIIPNSRETGQWSGELPAIHKDGRTFPVRLSLSVVKGEHGRPLVVIGRIQNITERKQAEQAMKQQQEQLTRLVEERTRELSSTRDTLRREMADREKMERELLAARKRESLGVLAEGMARDFNNLFASVRGNVSLAMLDLKPGNRAHLQLEGAEKAALRAQELTRQLLAFSKGGEPVKQTKSVGDLIREATGFILRDSRLKLFFSLPENLRPVEVDASQIGEVLHTLILAGNQAMPGGGTITITCENAVVDSSSKMPLRPGDYVRINVRDHGIGMAPENLSKIFDPSFTAKQKEGGLGLAEVYSIIKQHNGHIFAESELGIGTTFIIYLPATDSVNNAERERLGTIVHGQGKNTAAG